MEMRQIANDQSDICNHVSVDVENQLKLVNFVRDKLRLLSPLSSECCIYRAPKQLRQAAEKSFIPKVVSIGPLHHNREDLQDMEVHKLRYLKEFLHRTEVKLEDCIKLIKNSEVRVRNCYAETIDVNSDSFVEMILVDATFIIEVLLRTSFPELISGNDCIVGRRRMLKCVALDMLLLENQIPFFVIEDLLSQANVVFSPENDDVRFTMFKLTGNLLNSVSPRVKGREGFINKPHSSRIEHFLDFVRITLLPPKLPAQKYLLRSLSSIPTVTQLYQAGVKFKAQHSRNLLDVRFEKGILEIPCMYLCVSREDLFKNLIAYEQCHFNDAYLNNFAFLMDRLVQTSKDVEILIQNQILETNFPDNQRATTFIKNLAPGAIMIGDDFIFADLCEDLNVYCRVPWHKWKATLKRDYFSTPWAIISVIAAIVLLLLTFLQTLFTINSNKCS
ncbi:hypothetical protein Lal_00031351 [Lupinus albus]|uniref:Uncharacterized protein n=1 Tax=Lupinus albus TaxID=3870 RepID=A0A6A5LPC3_LUPAL|nr:hypothetical protein Lalb_Chr17g0338201 [Lupinus albus]KAF1863266.1 hypothetical protein Lal_00031351 [Lupinus albus]